VTETSLLDDLLRHKLGVIDRKLEELESLGEGDRKLVSILMAYVKRVEVEHAKLKDHVDSMMSAMVEHRDDITAMTERLDKASEWLKTKGMK
jgi:epoxyqueuosine reductase QueG